MANTKNILSFSLSGPHLRSMLGRFVKIAKTTIDHSDRGKILLRTTSSEDYKSDQLTVLCAGHPASVIVKTTTGEGKSLLVHQAGEVVVALEDFSALLSAMPEDILDIDVDEKMKMRIRPAGHASKPKTRSFAHQTMSAENYPPLSESHATIVTRELKNGMLETLLRRVRFAIDHVTSDRPMLLGVMLEFDLEKVTAIATDGHCMAVAETAGAFGDKGSLFVPRDLVDLILIGAGNETFSLSEDNSRVYAETEYTSMNCLKPGLGFPPWRMYLDEKVYDNSCDVDGPQLADAIRALSTVGRLKGGGEKSVESKFSGLLRLVLQGQELELSMRLRGVNEDLAGGRETLEVKNTENFRFSTTVDAAMLGPMARQVSGVCKLAQTGPLDPLLLKSSDGFIGFVMPLRDE